jgi:hypothetical protein
MYEFTVVYLHWFLQMNAFLVRNLVIYQSPSIVFLKFHIINQILDRKFIMIR